MAAIDGDDTVLGGHRGRSVADPDSVVETKTGSHQAGGPPSAAELLADDGRGGNVEGQLVGKRDVEDVTKCESVAPANSDDAGGSTGAVEQPTTLVAKPMTIVSSGQFDRSVGNSNSPTQLGSSANGIEGNQRVTGPISPKMTVDTEESSAVSGNATTEDVVGKIDRGEMFEESNAAVYTTIDGEDGPAMIKSEPMIGNGQSVSNSEGGGIAQLPRGTGENETASVAEEQPPGTAKARSVRFASTNKVKNFHAGCAVLSLAEEKERDVELQTSPKEVKRRKRKRSYIVAGEAKRIQQFSLPKSKQLTQSECISQQMSDQYETKKKPIQIAILHSHAHTLILHHAMQYIHRDRDILLESLVKWCGIFNGASRNGALSSFLTVLPPLVGTRKMLEVFHDKAYLDLLEFPQVSNPAPETSDASMELSSDMTDDGCDEDLGAYVSSADCESSAGTPDKESEQQSGDGEGGTSSDSFEPQLSPPSPDEPHLQPPSSDILSEYGLEDDCPFPTTPQAHNLLWKYCLAIAGASWHASSLLTANDVEKRTDVAIHWGGGRHHAHAKKAGGFCYVSDVVLAICRLLGGHNKHIDVGMLEDGDCGQPVQRNIYFGRILYLDIDIHHSDAVQAAFYETDRVLTASFHRRAPGFFPATSGAISEKGKAGTSGLGYNLNVPLPAGTGDVQFIQIYRKALFGLVKAYGPDAIVLCVGADGLEGDELVSGGIDGNAVSGEGWSLSPEGLAECVRIAAAHCAGLSEEDICCDLRKQPETMKSNDSEKDGNSHPPDDVKSKEPARGKRRKLLVLGGGGYTPAQTARTHLLCSAAACEGARPGMLWSDLPRDIPNHDYFPRYGPSFELVSDEKKNEILGSYSSSDTADGNERDGVVGTNEVSESDRKIFEEAKRTIELSTTYVSRQREKNEASQQSQFCFTEAKGQDEWPDEPTRKKKGAKKGGGRRRKRKKAEGNDPQQTES